MGSLIGDCDRRPVGQHFLEVLDEQLPLEQFSEALAPDLVGLIACGSPPKR